MRSPGGHKDAYRALVLLSSIFAVWQVIEIFRDKEKAKTEGRELKKTLARIESKLT